MREGKEEDREEGLEVNSDDIAVEPRPEVSMVALEAASCCHLCVCCCIVNVGSGLLNTLDTLDKALERVA